ncbi:hypothetical protein EYF80_024813 [Liparis tanakae]|uniref:Uncharacterized protein n=1 Tax=Liparis tanakae TaxID=230148 RepID=A0A4Z2HGD5_9TELE|nr:hypothetical protein EYF80_024813 [Liparis tanakae]
MANERIAEQPVDPHRRLLKQTPRFKPVRDADETRHRRSCRVFWAGVNRSVNVMLMCLLCKRRMERERVERERDTEIAKDVGVRPSVHISFTEVPGASRSRFFRHNCQSTYPPTSRRLQSPTEPQTKK